MKLLLTALLLAFPCLARADGGWVLEQSTIAYHVSHPLHESVGVSHAARGKAVCLAGRCDVLVAAPVNSFDSGDSNRDLHMIQITRGALFPMIVVRTNVPESPSEADFNADLKIEFSSRTVTYAAVPFHRTQDGTATRLSGTIPLKIADFGVEAPKLLTMPIKDEAPVTVDLLWRKK
jgi:hypothetical protein